MMQIPHVDTPFTAPPDLWFVIEISLAIVSATDVFLIVWLLKHWRT